MPKTLRALLLTTLIAGTAPAAAGSAQTPEAPAPAPAPGDSVGVDSLRVSPRAALFRSLAVPGWGQAYVGAPVRGGIYFALETGSLWMLLRSRAELQQARVRERFLKDAGTLPISESLTLAEARRKQVEDWVTLSVFFVLFSGADAYVAAQLSDFSQHVGVIPDETGTLRLEARFPTGVR
jgi:hypothetical protein